MHMKKCSSCSKEITGKVYPNGYCQACYRYFSTNTIHPIPEPGTIGKDENGLLICHICGRSYRRLGSHVKESHQLTIAAYKELFGLCKSAKTTEDSYSKTMSNYAYKYNMPDQLMTTGKDTRFQKGDKIRKGVPVRLQERISLTERTHKHTAE